MNDLSTLVGGCLTPPGEGGLLIFRVAGSRVPTLLQGIFRPRGDTSVSHGGRVRFGHLVDGDEVVDEALLMLEPRGSAVEFSTHGGLGTQSAVEGLLRRFGVTLLDGERLLETAARRPSTGPAVVREAQAGLRAAWSEQAMLFFLDVLEERLIAEVESLRRGLLASSGSKEPHGARLDTLIARAPLGLAFWDPPRIALVGPPNAGKSSLANALLGHDRFIVTPEAGTTRDLIAEDVLVEGFPFRLMDAAGLRETNDPIEIQGIERARAAARAASVVLLVLDASRPLGGDAAWAEWRSDPRTLVCLNKVDLEPLAYEIDPRTWGRPLVFVSALRGIGLSSLARTVVRHSVFGGAARRELPCPFTPRQLHRLEEARQTLTRGDAPVQALKLFLEESA